MFEINATRIRELLFQSGLSLREFAAKAGLNTATACKLIRDGATASLKTIGTAVKFFNVSGESLILKN